MTEIKTRRGRVIWQGSVPATDPFYQNGWNFLTGSNLRPPSKEPPRAPEAKPEEAPPPQKD
jgi:hypothetical protein